MSIILHENEWAKDMLENCTMGKKPSETLRRIARYYLDTGLSKKSVENKLTEFILQCDPKASIPNWDRTIESALKGAARFKAIDIDSIDISDTELKQINSLKGRQIKRLAFTLLCLAKYWNKVFLNSNSWIKTEDSEIMSLANISTSVQRQCSMYRELQDKGMIYHSKKVDSLSIKVCFIDDGNTALQIKDFRNLGYQYLMFLGEPYFKCQCCGITIRMNNPNNKGRQKYCKSCAARIKLKQNVDSAMRQEKIFLSKNNK